jgi:hypothetical protein
MAQQIRSWIFAQAHDLFNFGVRAFKILTNGSTRSRPMHGISFFRKIENNTVDAIGFLMIRVETVFIMDE